MPVPARGAAPNFRSPVFDVIGRGGGRPLDDELRRAMEERLGEPFDTVRLHLDARSTESVDANAYAVGEEIVLHPSFAQLRGAEGQKLLAHELAHVVQQRRGAVDGSPAPGGIRVSDPSDRFERAAEATARLATSGGRGLEPDAAGSRPVDYAPNSLHPLTVQRDKHSRGVLYGLARPKVGEAPAKRNQKTLVKNLEKLLKVLDAEDKGQAPKRYPSAPAWRGSFGMINFDSNAGMFNLGGILIDSLPPLKKGQKKESYKEIAKCARFVRLDKAAASKGTGLPLPEVLDAGLAGPLMENVLKTMIDAGQFAYLRAVGIPDPNNWKILAEVHYMRARPKDMSGFHKDTLGQTLFVNLNYHVEDKKGTGLALRGPEFVVNPAPSATHDQQTGIEKGTAGSLPHEFAKDVRKLRAMLPDPTEIESAGTVSPYGYVAFVDEALHHATPFFDHRYVTPKDFSWYLATAYPFCAKLNNTGDKVVINWTKIPYKDAEKWEAWELLANASDTPTGAPRYARDTFTNTMGAAIGTDNEFDRMLQVVGARTVNQTPTAREGGGVGGWYAGSIANAGGNAPLVETDVHGTPKRVLTRQASQSNLTAQWPQQLPTDVNRRFMRTWVRAIPKALADQL